MNFPKRRKAQKLGVRDTPQIRCAQHLQWIRGFVCFLHDSHTACEGKTEAAHGRTGADGGMGVKPSDCWTIPLCAGHHRIQHNMGEKAFEAAYKLNMKASAEHFWRMSPHGKRYRELKP